MDNLVITAAAKSQIPIGVPINICYEHATRTLIVVNSQSVVHFVTFNPSKQGIFEANQANPFTLRASTSPLEELQGQKITFIQYLVDNSEVLIFTQNGSIMTVNEDGMVDVKAQNDDGITGGSISPDQEYIYVVTNNNTLIQLDMEYDLVKEVPLDDSAVEKSSGYEPRFSWKADGTHFAINIQTDKGRKCHTRDSMLGIFRSPSLSDPDPEGLVQSVSEKSRENMSKVVCWQPSAGIIAGSDFINVNGKKINRVIFWQKNSLRHLQFNLPDNVTDVLQLKWAPDSQILLVQILRNDSTRWLYFYYRGNYHWYLKNTLKLTGYFQDSQQQASYIITRNKKYNYLIIASSNKLTALQLDICLNKKTNKNHQQQKQNNNMICYAVDGPVIKVSNYSRGLIPPPMCHKQVKFATNVYACDVNGDDILVFTEGQVAIYTWNAQICKLQIEGECLSDCGYIVGLNFYENLSESKKFCMRTHEQDVKHYEIKQGKIIAILDNPSHQQPSTKYTFTIKQQLQQETLNKTIKINNISLKNQQLKVNDDKIIDHCTSFILYHEFLIFTCSTSDMYDKLYVFDLQLDAWIANEDQFSDDKMRMKIDDCSTKKLLNCRTIERGARIVCCTKNKVVFQLPRGNLQGIFPKVVMIKHVKKCMETGKFQQAFQTIRTHKLDLNLLYDLNPQNFTENSHQILTGFNKTDYINLFVSQLKNQVTSELQYCLPQKQIQQNTTFINIKLDGNKIHQVCSIVSSTLRKSQNMEKYILSIFTSDIKMDKLNQVLFEIKEMKENDIDVEVPPHLQENIDKSKKKLTPQQILEYVCWLVDANAIYDASLLTYDIELAAMTARCTQMDPKEYLPYLQALKEIEDPIQLRKKICMDLKKYDKAIQELSKGNQEQKQFSIELIIKHKLYKCGLKTYHSQIPYLKRVKQIIIDELLKSGENNQAYKLALSISDLDKALQISVQSTDGKKIIEVIELMDNLNQEQRRQKVLQIIKQVGIQGFKNKNQYARLLVFIGSYDEGVRNFLAAGNYQKAFKYLNKISQELRYGEELKQQMRLLFSLQKNLLLKQKKQIIQKYDRLTKVHKQKSMQGDTLTARNRENDDMYSEVSVSSKTGSSYTISTTTGMRKKKDKKRSILSRNVKEGSLLEEEYLVTFLHDVKKHLQPNIKQTKLLIQHLIYMNLIQQAEILKDLGNQYAQQVKKCCPKYYAQVRFENDHPEFSQILEVYQDPLGQDKDRQKLKKPAIQSFSYLF